MDKRISDWLRQVPTGWVALAALVIFMLFTALVLPQQASKAAQETGGAVSPDTSFFYVPDDLYRMAEAYGEPGRQAYIRARFTFDLVWPLLYTLFLATAISWVFGRAFALDSRWQRANLAPLWGALFDYLENLSTSLVMLRYPAQTAVVDLLAPVFTALKWVSWPNNTSERRTVLWSDQSSGVIVKETGKTWRMGLELRTRAPRGYGNRALSDMRA